MTEAQIKSPGFWVSSINNHVHAAGDGYLVARRTLLNMLCIFSLPITGGVS